MPNEILSISHLTKQFDAQTVLRDISFDVREGEVIVIVGPSGCGKSTLLRCMNALEDIQSGEIRLRGEPVRRDGSNLAEIRQKIGMVFQSYELFPHLNVLDNILLAPLKVQKRPRKEAEAEALTMLSRVGLADKARSFPRQLSGGQKQRVAIVRALMMHPEVQGKTMLIVTHEMQFARAVADKVIFLEDGVIKETGTPAQFFDAPKTERAKEFLRTFSFERKRTNNIAI